MLIVNYYDIMHYSPTVDPIATFVVNKQFRQLVANEDLKKRSRLHLVRVNKAALNYAFPKKSG